MRKEELAAAVRPEKVESRVELVAVDQSLLESLIEVATTDAAADEVTPPVTSGPSWTPARIAWLRDFHVARRAGLDGPAGEATWAVTLDQRVVGSVRLQRTEQSGALETGVWLTRSSRGRGVGRAAVEAVLRKAIALDFTSVCARTTAGNSGALRVLKDLGFDLASTDDDRSVRALLVLRP